MLEVIEKLLILQDRDRKILQTKQQLEYIPLERKTFQEKLAAAQARVEELKNRARSLESERKRLELEVEGLKEQIERYSVQQFQTRKNEEYRALTKEIETCKAKINSLDDQQLEIMEQLEGLQKEIKTAENEAAAQKRETEERLKQLADREQALQRELSELEANRNELAAAIDEPVRRRYERLLQHRGHNVLVGINKGVCGGCHMQLSRQTVVSCCAEKEIVTCDNCGRILYHTPDMDVAPAQ